MNALDKQKSHPLWLPVSGGNSLLSGCCIDAQSGPSDFSYVEDKPPGFISILNVSQGTILYFCLGLHHFMVYPENVKESLVQKCMVKEISIPPNPALTVYDYLQHSAAGWCCKYCPRHYMYPILESLQVEDTVPFAYSNTLSKAENSS